MNPRTTCPDCEGPLVSITLRDYGYGRPPDPPEYELDEAPGSFWMGLKPTAGTIHGRMCAECGRVLLYAKPRPGS